MTTHETFLREIVQDPADDGARRIYADWLEEQGDPRGEFIHIQCTLGQLLPWDVRRQELEERERQLLAQHGTKWIGDLRRLGTYSHRGNVHHVYHVCLPSTELVIDPNEIAAVAWFTVDDVRDLVALKRIFAPFMLDAILATRA